jgi:hypothetical protein
MPGSARHNGSGLENAEKMKRMHLISLDEPFNGGCLKCPVAIWDDSFTDSEMVRKCGLLRLVASISGSLSALFGVSW